MCKITYVGFLGETIEGDAFWPGGHSKALTSCQLLLIDKYIRKLLFSMNISEQKKGKQNKLYLEYSSFDRVGSASEQCMMQVGDIG